MFGLFIHFFVLQAWVLLPTLCLRLQDLTDEQHQELKKYLYELDKATDRSKWKEPNNIFEDVPTFEPTYQSDSPFVLNEDIFEEIEQLSDENETLQREDKTIQKSDEAGTCSKNGDECQEIKPVLISNSEHLKTSAKPNACENNTIYLQRWLKMFLNKFRSINGNLHTKVISMRIADETLNQIHSILKSKTVTFVNADNIISAMLLDLIVHDEPSWFELILGYWKFIFSVVLVVVISKLYIIYPKSTLFLFFIALCTAWQWKQLYEEAIAKKHADLEQIHFPSVCKRHELGIVENFRLWFHGLTVSQGTCKDYYKAVMVDPFWEVTPSMALSAALSKFLFYPLEVLAETTNNFVKLLFKDLSLTSQLVVILILLFLLLVVANYRIRMPFFLTLEPVNKIASVMAKKDEQPLSLTRANFAASNSTDLSIVSNSDSNFNHGLFKKKNDCIKSICSHYCDKTMSVTEKLVDRTSHNSDKHYSLCSHHDDCQIKSSASQSNIKSESSEDSGSIQSSNQEQQNPPCLLTSEMALLKIDDNTTLNSENTFRDSNQDLLTSEIENLNLNDDKDLIQSNKEDLIHLSEENLIHLSEALEESEQISTKVPSSDKLIEL